LFSRLEKTYDLKSGIVRDILADEASPLNRIARLVPDNSKVLDIGAGNGLLAQVMREVHLRLTIDGIEPDPYAAEMAAQHYRTFFRGYSDAFMEEVRAQGYDFIVLADVIEHMPDPLRFMRELVSGLSPRTRIVLSIPNVAFGAVRASLLGGRFEYCDSGILERTHLRFFTLATIEELVNQLDMRMEKLYYLERELFATEIAVQRLGVNLPALHRIMCDPLSSVYQFLVVLSREETATERRSFGRRTRFPVFAYVASRLRERVK
jgi:2-polyprenyl-3-methyl-5-hydroxy-6-metoxy-1,4-benzoquinol methylase